MRRGRGPFGSAVPLLVVADPCHELDAGRRNTVLRQHEALALAKPLLLLPRLRRRGAVLGVNQLSGEGTRLHPLCQAETLRSELALLGRRSARVYNHVVLVEEIEATDTNGVARRASPAGFEARVHAPVDVTANEASPCVGSEAGSPHATFNKRILSHADDTPSIWQSDVGRLATVLRVQREMRAGARNATRLQPGPLHLVSIRFARS